MKNFKFKIVSPSNRKIYSFEIPKRYLWIFMVAGIIIVGFILLYFFRGVKDQYLITKLSMYKNQNKELKNNYEKYSKKIKTYDKKLSKLQQICDNVLILNSLPPAFKENSKMHVGGRSLKNPENESVDDMNNNLKVAFSQVDLKMEVLKDNFYKIIDKMEKSSIKWEHVPLKWPLEGWISSQYGWRESPFSNEREFHTGLDITNIPGSPIKAPAQGYVKFTGWMGEYGKTIVIEHGFGYETRYGHLKKITVNEGSFVKKGDQLGTLGNTGRSSAPHLHYEILKNGKVENPMKYLLTEDNKILRRVSQFYGR